MSPVAVFVEGATDVPVARKVLEFVGLDYLPPVPLRGSSQLDAVLPKILRTASKRAPIFILRDVDPTPPNHKGTRHPQCGGAVLAALGVANIGAGHCLRLARHEMEAWLMADAQAFSRWLHCPSSVLPARPDDEVKPSLSIVDLARDRRVPDELRRQLVPRPESGARFGPGFEQAIIRFAAGKWSVKRALSRSRSLTRCIAALRRFAASLR